MSNLERSAYESLPNNFQFSMLSLSCARSSHTALSSINNISDRDRRSRCSNALLHSIFFSSLLLACLFFSLVVAAAIRDLDFDCPMLISDDDDHVTSHFLYCNCTTCCAADAEWSLFVESLSSTAASLTSQSQSREKTRPATTGSEVTMISTRGRLNDCIISSVYED